MESIRLFMNLNPWSFFFTLISLCIAVNLGIRVILDKEYLKFVLISLLLCGVSGLFYSVIGFSHLAHWINGGTGNYDFWYTPFIYWLLLGFIDLMFVGIRRHNRPDLQTEDDDNDGAL